jgi:hypothetical protein
MKILFISQSNRQEIDYQCDIIFHGLKTLYGKDVYETANNWFMFNDISAEQKSKLYGKGFTIAGLLDSKLKNILTNYETIRKIKLCFFDFIIYGSIYKCQSFFGLVSRYYPKNKILVIDGEDLTAVLNFFIGKCIYFKRELDKNINDVYPISFGIPKEKIVENVKEKSRILAHIIPGDLSTYIYDNEKDYYNGYAESYFGKTIKKAGWDCLRHYEIMANGCIPYFPDLADCPKETMVSFPKEIVLETNLLFENNVKDDKILLTYSQRILDYTKQSLTTDVIARYIIDKALSLKDARISNRIYLQVQWILHSIKTTLIKVKRKIL